MALTHRPRTDELDAALWADRLSSPTFSPAEQASLDAWLAAAPDRQRLLAAHRRLLEADALRWAMTTSRVKASRRKSRRLPRGFSLAVLATAAAALVAVAVWPRPSLDLRTPQGRPAAETLADGSQVMLNGDTEARVRLARGARDIRLERGEAYFKVAHDPARPFTVHAPEAAVTAVGTAFNVNRLDGATEITVYEGKVRVTPDFARGRPIFLVAGQKVRVSADRIENRSDFAVGAMGDWRSGWVEMDNGTLGDLVTELNRASGTPIELADPRLEELRLTGRFRVDQPREAAQLAAATHRLRLVAEADRLRLAR